MFTQKYWLVNHLEAENLNHFYGLHFSKTNFPPFFDLLFCSWLWTYYMIIVVCLSFSNDKIVTQCFCWKFGFRFTFFRSIKFLSLFHFHLFFTELWLETSKNIYLGSQIDCKLNLRTVFFNYFSNCGASSAIMMIKWNQKHSKYFNTFLRIPNQ